MTLLWLARVLFGLETLVAWYQTWLGLRRGMKEQNGLLGPWPIAASIVLTLVVVAFCELWAVPTNAITGATIIYGIGIAARLVSIIHDALKLRRA